VFSAAVGEYVGADRYVKLNSKELFDASERGYSVLADYFQIKDISFDEYKAHFSRRLNEKQSSIELTDAERESLIGDFREVLASLDG
jgi:hypothetical protein